MPESVERRVDEGVAILTLTRPEKYNALNDVMMRELLDALRELRYDEDVRALVLEGADGVFCSGADIDAINDGRLRSPTFKTGITRNMQRSLENFPAPTVVAIEGYALGAGLEVAACADFRVAAADAELGFPEIGLGLFPGIGGTQRIPRLIGVPEAKRLILSGDRISGQRAEEIGLVEVVAEPGSALEEAIEYASQFTDNSPMAVATAKMAINDVWKGNELDDGLLFENALSDIVHDTEDRQEAIDAMAEDREPTWRAR